VKANPEKTQKTRIEFYLSYMALATAMAPVAGRVDIVIATSPPLFTGLAGLALARVNRAPFILDVRDLWPAAAVSLDQIPSARAVEIGERIERLLYRQAAAVTTVTEPFIRHIEAIRRRAPSPSLVVNGTLDMFFDVGFDRAARAELGVPDDRFLAMFAGTLGIAQAIPSVLDAAELTGDDVHFAFVGDGPIRDIVARDAADRGLANVHFHPQVPLDKVSPLLAAADAFLVPLSAHPTFAEFIPSKLIDFMATGHPVVVSATGEAASIVERVRGGVVVPPENPQALATALRELAADPDAGRELGRRAREFAASRLRDAQAERLEQVLFAALR
jgi:glycosyltransferase involved in cell wall biosynthesis